MSLLFGSEERPGAHVLPPQDSHVVLGHDASVVLPWDDPRMLVDVDTHSESYVDSEERGLYPKMRVGGQLEYLADLFRQAVQA
jgi:hypothetical protein